MNQTIMIVAGVVVVWAVLFVVMMSFQKKRKAGEQQFNADNAYKALIHLYCDHIAIDGSSLSTFSHTKGEYMQTIVALEPGQHKLEGIFRSTEAGVTGNKNLVSEKLSIDIDLEAGHVYSAAMYFYSSEDRNEYYKGQTRKVIAEVPLSIVKGSDQVKAYVIVYEEQ